MKYRIILFDVNVKLSTNTPCTVLPSILVKYRMTMTVIKIDSNNNVMFSTTIIVIQPKRTVDLLKKNNQVHKQ